VKIEANSENAEIMVKDNGIGIEQKHIDYIFDMFYRASEASYGSGLGLYILKNAVQKIKGTIEVVSSFGEGTTFKINIPNCNTSLN
jgi:signal transduction histidine kinase